MTRFCPTRLLAVLVLTVGCGLCGHAFCAEPPGPSAPQNLLELFREYRADEGSVEGYFRLPASAAFLDRIEQLDSGWLTRLEKVNFDALDQSGKINYLLLTNEVQRSLEDMAAKRRQLAELEQLLSFRATIHVLEETRRRAAPLDCQAAAAKVAELAEQVRQLRERVDKGNKQKAEGAKPAAAEVAGGDNSAAKTPDAAVPLVVSPAVALRAAAAVRQLRETLKEWFTFYDGYQPQFAWWLKKPYKQAGKELDDYAKLLREEVVQCKGRDDDPLIGEPLGADALAAAIRLERLPYTAEELIAIGERELAWCEQQMKTASREMNLGDDWKAALAKVKADFAPPGQQDEFVAQTAREAIDFVKQKKLVTVPPLCEQTWRLRMISPEGMKTIPYAAYGGQHIMVAYANSEMKHEDKLMAMRGNNRHFMRTVIPHELIPGHHLQFFYAARHDARHYSTPFYHEGWALYWELRLWDLGWARTPEDRMGMLFWRMNRCARVIVSLRFHLGQMTPQEMVDFLVERIGHEKLGATSEVRRFVGADPLYQASYLLGGLQLYALQKEMVGGGKMTDPQFHDAVLKEGPMPIELLRAGILGLPLTRTTTPTWRFADERRSGVE